MTIPAITTQDAIEALLAAGPCWLFKHSNACPISFAAHDEVEAFLAGNPMPIGMVVVQTSRPISNWLAARLGYVHQSPQLFLVVDGAVRWHASHYGITAVAMRAAVS